MITDILFSILSAIIILLVYNIMVKLLDIEKQLVEMRTDIMWMKKYLNTHPDNTGDKHEHNNT